MSNTDRPEAPRFVGDARGVTDAVISCYRNGTAPFYKTPISRFFSDGLGRMINLNLKPVCQSSKQDPRADQQTSWLCHWQCRQLRVLRSFFPWLNLNTPQEKSIAIAKRIWSRFCIIPEHMAGLRCPFGLATPRVRMISTKSKHCKYCICKKPLSIQQGVSMGHYILCNTCVSKSEVRKRP